MDNPTKNPDGSIDIYFGPDSPGEGKNWLTTLPDKGFFVILRLYGPTKAFFDKTWKLPDILEHFSRFIPLVPGDMFSTGAPGGVAVGKPNAEALYLKPGDVVECGIEGNTHIRSIGQCRESLTMGASFGFMGGMPLRYRTASKRRPSCVTGTRAR
jgi:hypothetical protein